MGENYRFTRTSTVFVYDDWKCWFPLSFNATIDAIAATWLCFVSALANWEVLSVRAMVVKKDVLCSSKWDSILSLLRYFSRSFTVAQVWYVDWESSISLEVGLVVTYLGVFSDSWHCHQHLQRRKFPQYWCSWQHFVPISRSSSRKILYFYFRA